MEERDAWRRKYVAQPKPWAGPVHAAPLLADLPTPIVELGAGGGKVGATLPEGTLALDWVAEGLPPARPALVADARRLPLATGRVGALVALHVLGHQLAPGREAAAREWARVLRPGGVLVLEAFECGDARAGTGLEVEPGTRVREGIPTHHFTLDEVRALFPWPGEARVEARAQRWGVRRVVRARLVRP